MSSNSPGCAFLTSWESGNEKGHGARHSEVAPQSPALGEPSPSALSSQMWMVQHHGQRLPSTLPSALWACHWVCVGCFAAVGWETMEPAPRVFTTRLSSCPAPAGGGQAHGHGCGGGRVVPTKAAETEKKGREPGERRLMQGQWMRGELRGRSVRPVGWGGGRLWHLRVSLDGPDPCPLC